MHKGINTTLDEGQTLIATNGGGFDAVCATADTAHALTAEGFDASGDGTGSGTPVIAFSSKDYGADAETDLAPTLRAGGHHESHANAGVPPAIAFNARQDPDAWEDRTGPLDTDGGTIAVTYDLNQITSKDNRSQPKPGLCHTIPATGTPPHLDMPWAVRRLTETETARLQGYPDDHTKIPWRGRPAEECPAGPQYKAHGNGMAVPVVRYILDRMRRSMEAMA
jgi:DNA (cytosine-5)-methyltransferase 1